MSAEVFTGPGNEPSLTELSRMSVESMREVPPSIIADILKELLPTGEEISRGFEQQTSQMMFEEYTSTPLVFTRAHEWFKAAGTFIGAYPHHEYSLTASHAREWLQEEL